MNQTSDSAPPPPLPAVLYHREGRVGKFDAWVITLYRQNGIDK